MSYLVRLGFIEMVKSAREGSGTGENYSQAWFEGFAHGLHEAEHLNEDELENVVAHHIPKDEEE